jgi:RNA polymerase sigma factor (sigma-70 family)
MDAGLTRDRIAHFFSRERRRLVGYVRQLIDETAETGGEDIVQDVAYNLFSRADVSAPIGELSAYVYQALRNRVVDAFRRRRKSISLETPVADSEGLRLADILPDARHGAEEKADLHRRVDGVYRAMKQLSDRERAVILATEIEGWTYRELAERWNVPLGTLLAQKSRALAKVRRTLGAEEYDKSRNGGLS